MDFDPLADAGPSRYAIESDEEDEYNPLEEQHVKRDEQDQFQGKISGSIRPDAPLLAVFGDAGKYWAKGADLGEQTGAIFVNDVQVGLVFNPSWTKSTVIVSEATTRLPITFMNEYASLLVAQLKPSSVSILDVYPSPTYISSSPIPQHEAPIRYLCSTKSSRIAQSTKPFSPPNLIHSSTSAALLAHIVTQAAQVIGTLVLLPFPRVTAPPPKTLHNSDLSHLSEDDYQWTSEHMNNAHNLLLVALDEETSSGWTKPDTSNHESNTTKREHHTTVGEGAMYI